MDVKSIESSYEKKVMRKSITFFFILMPLDWFAT